MSEAPKPAPGSNAPKYSSKVLHEKSDQEKKEELVAAMINKMGDKEDEPLPQDDVDGVDSDEWVSTSTCSVILSIKKNIHLFPNSLLHLFTGRLVDKAIELTAAFIIVIIIIIIKFV